MAKHTSFFSKVKGSIGELVFRSGASPGVSIASERAIFSSIPPADFTDQQWLVFNCSKVVAKIRSLSPVFDQSNNLFGLLPAWQSLMLGIMDASKISSPGLGVKAFIPVSLNRIVPFGELHFPETGGVVNSSVNQEFVISWSTELGKNGAANDRVQIYFVQTSNQLLDSSGNVDSNGSWVVQKSGIRSDGGLVIPHSDLPPGSSAIGHAVIFLNSQPLTRAKDSSSIYLIYPSVSWSILNQ